MIVLTFLLHAGLIFSQEQNEDAQNQIVTDAVKTYKKIEITTDEDEFFLNTISPHRVSKEKLSLYNYTDATRALKQTAGVYSRDEDGQGLRPNIGLRGTNPDRSKKVVFLEDGILIGPAPYSAPAAYYTPSMQHTESLDIYKGFTAVPYGPNSIGGSVNYVTTSIPGSTLVKGSASAGAFNTQTYKLTGGTTFNKSSFLIEGSRLSSDGFKKIDGGGDAGFEKNEVLLKFRQKLSSLSDNRQHFLEARVGYSDEISNETYLGLSTSDLNASPFRRYSSSALDKMEWQHSKVQLDHVYDISTSTRLKTSLYRNDFERLWFRLDRFANGTSIFNVLTYPQFDPVLAGVLQGTGNSSDSNGNLKFLGNQRSFYSQGLQTQINTQGSVGSATFDTELGLRFHQDQIRRTHTVYDYAMEQGQLVPLNFSQPEVLNRNRATALTAHLIENVNLGDWVFTALGRAESVKFNFSEYVIDNNFNQRSIERNETAFAPGAAILYKITPHVATKLSVNKGVSLAGLSDSGTENPEESINYEWGLKYISSDNRSQGEIVAFYNDYSNITGTCTTSTGCSSAQLDRQFNGGRALIQGIEGRVAQQFQLKDVQIPVQFNLTLLNAEFRNTFASQTAEWGVGTVRSGDPLPYIPQIQYTLALGANYKKFNQEVAFIYQGASFDQSARVNRLEIPAFGIVDWTGKYNMNKKTQIFARIDNVFARDYLVSYKPFGARPGKPQSFMAGLSYSF